MKKVFFIVFFVLFVIAGAFAQDIGRVESTRNNITNATNFVVFGTNGARLSSTNLGAYDLVGWGRSFFVVRAGNIIHSHDISGRRIGSYSPGVDIVNVFVLVDSVTVLQRCLVFQAEELCQFVDPNVLVRLNRELRLMYVDSVRPCFLLL